MLVLLRVTSRNFLHIFLAGQLAGFLPIGDIQLLLRDEEEISRGHGNRASTDERLINSHRERRDRGETRTSEKGRAETRGEFRIYSAYDL